MTYAVTLCDSSFADIMVTTIVLEATSSGGTVLSSLNNGVVAGGYGAALAFTPPNQRFNIEIDTTGTIYAPLVLEDLNGNRHPQTINVILLTPPMSSQGQRPSTAGAVKQFIQQQQWTDEEVAAVYATMKSLSYANRRAGSRTQQIRKHAELILGKVGILPDLIAF
jgi:hypothetical protein